MKKGRQGPPKTGADFLDALPQFQPGGGFDIDHVNTETGSVSGFSPQRREEIRKVLTEHIEPYVRTVNWLDEPTGLERFLREAESAIAIYLDQRNVQPAFDREKAKAYLGKAADAVSAAQKKLQAIAGWPELSSFLERLFATEGTGRENGFKMSEETLSQFHKKTRRERKRGILRDLEPKHVALLLSRLEPLLTLAAERVEFQPGDYQRDDAAREIRRPIGLCLDLRHGTPSDLFDPFTSFSQTLPFRGTSYGHKRENFGLQNSFIQQFSIVCTAIRRSYERAVP